MTALTGETVRTPRPRQSRADAQKVYEYVTERDQTCRAPAIDADGQEWPSHACVFDCRGPLERHHAGNTIGSKRITDARHHATWAPTHSRLILKIEDERERA